jgi:hypothetical protein
MANEAKEIFLEQLVERYGTFRRLPRSRSLYELHPSRVRVYIRYSKVHERNQTFYGLREDDLRQLEGHPSVICFLWDTQSDPLLIPFDEYEEVFQTTRPARDGQYKAQIYLLGDGGTDLYIAQAGRFNVEGSLGWAALDKLTKGVSGDVPRNLTHGQMQTFLGAIGSAKGYDVWVPMHDRTKLDWSVAHRFDCRTVPPYGFQTVAHIIQEVDVVWLRRGSSEPSALFEVEHSTSIYSGLLRFNDVHLVAPELPLKFSIVADDVRRDVFVKQLNRPTFRTNGLSEICSFLDYINVYEWYKRIRSTSP